MIPMLAVFDVHSLYILFSLPVFGVIACHERKEEIKRRVWIKACKHCGGDQMLDYEGRMYSTYLVAVRKCLQCSRTEDFMPAKKRIPNYAPYKIENRNGR